MLFEWFADRRRQALLAQPFPEEWIELLTRDVKIYSTLSAEERNRLHDLLRVFMAEKSWEGCGGLTLTDEIKVTVSAQACLLVLGFEHETYRNVESILVYPTAFVAAQPRVGPDGVVESAPYGLLGEAWHKGPVILSWIDAREEAKNPAGGHNVVFHEFAHKLDLRDGSADGVPKLADDAEYEQWAEVMSAEYADLVERAEHRRKSLLDPYGATDPAEFFAVATECFFDRPRPMRQTHPRLYTVLRDFYRQDPAARFDAFDARE
jgi:Mlc titration factor MtfA (ptsG expression regulator)